MWIPKNIAVFLMVLFCAKMVVGHTLTSLSLFRTQVNVVHRCQHQKKIVPITKKAQFGDQETPTANFAINCHQVFLSSAKLELNDPIQSQSNTIFHPHHSSTPVSLEDPLPPPQVINSLV